MRFGFFYSLVLIILGVSFQGCKSDDNNPKEAVGLINNMTVAELPIIDGSDSTEPLRTILVSRLLGCSYQWKRNRPVIDYLGLRSVFIANPPDGLFSKMINSNTHPSFVKLIDGEVDIIITARGISRDEAKYALEKNVKLLEKPIAMDGLVFIVNAQNPVENLSHQQIKGTTLRLIAAVSMLNSMLIPHGLSLRMMQW